MIIVPAYSSLNSPISGCHAGLQHPDDLSVVDMWVGNPPRLEKVGVWVICRGIQGDAPMRLLLTRGLGTAAMRGCDQCGILAKKGQWNSNKYMGYSKPCDVDLRSKDGKFWGAGTGWANGTVASNKRPVSQAQPLDTHYLTSDQIQTRDLHVEKEVERLRAAHKQNPAAADKAIEAMYMELGSRGQSEFAKSGLGYWDVNTGHPVAVYHSTYLGPAKDLIRWVLPRMRVGEKPTGALVLDFPYPHIMKAVWSARRKHVVFRNKPDCIVPDWMRVLGNMSMSETQLYYEVVVPYLVHDLHAFDVHPAVGAMHLLLRQAMMCFTRLSYHSEEEYLDQLRMGQMCAHAYGAIAEFFHSKHDNGAGLNQFGFTWKLHKLLHLAEQLYARGFTTEGSDAWVEGMMRHKASMLLKCDPMLGLYLSTSS
jgi:hypothetical protein